MKNRAVFLDRDGVLNQDRWDYTYRPDDFVVLPGVPEALQQLKAAGYHLIVVTNQAGIAKGLYTAAEVRQCHAILQEACGHVLDALYFAPGHPSVSESLSRKPDSLMIERAAARFGVALAHSWLVGDTRRDAQAGHKAGVGHLIHIAGREPKGPEAHWETASLLEATALILSNS
ncbi:D-glycero-D-manno-heptose 1,7-bisphosphate phosphatase [Catalinimonas alkaloidigena]|uniref:D,D-heptose 1,7-bisphosphate phosphatase n=1 Tax=Catalinimonas alkaloidigena TaxID=1075417 RepID=A0A1G9K2H5_9BACT|nr:HAD-IIIA family hydrolase [Catalinimonas alkaloidigena]SDL44100.1 D-glycero-D-manno-heptose 1,7-bisphosphate phosphatase [Catalinimonas alkaloidigena]